MGPDRRFAGDDLDGPARADAVVELDAGAFDAAFLGTDAMLDDRASRDGRERGPLFTTTTSWSLSSSSLSSIRRLGGMLAASWMGM